MCQAAANPGEDVNTASSKDNDARSFVEESENLAHHHLIFKFTATHPDVNISGTVAAVNVSDLKPSTLNTIYNSLLLSLDIINLAVSVTVQ